MGPGCVHNALLLPLPLCTPLNHLETVGAEGHLLGHSNGGNWSLAAAVAACDLGVELGLYCHSDHHSVDGRVEVPQIVVRGEDVDRGEDGVQVEEGGDLEGACQSVLCSSLDLQELDAWELDL